MNNSGRQIARQLLVVATLIVIAALVASCLMNPFNRRPNPAIAIVGGGLPYGAAPFTISFDISGSHDPDGNIVSYVFDFGDGSDPVEGTDLSQPITHTYDTPGSYFARLTVTDNGGMTAHVMLAVGVN